MTQERFDVVVVGAGLAGLTAAATAAGAGARALVVDGHAPGGRAATDQRGDYRFNRGAHALYNGSEAEAVLRRLNVTVAGKAPVPGASAQAGGSPSSPPGRPRSCAAPCSRPGASRRRPSCWPPCPRPARPTWPACP